jgi:hypothetical protein
MNAEPRNRVVVLGLGVLVGAAAIGLALTTCHARRVTGELEEMRRERETFCLTVRMATGFFAGKLEDFRQVPDTLPLSVAIQHCVPRDERDRVGVVLEDVRMDIWGALTALRGDPVHPKLGAIGLSDEDAATQYARARGRLEGLIEAMQKGP